MVLHRKEEFTEIRNTICMALFDLLGVTEGLASHLPAWCCTAGWRRAAGGWPPPAAAGHCGTGAAPSPPPRGSSGRSDRLVPPEPSASGTPFQTTDAKNKASATVRQICRTPRAFDAAKRKRTMSSSAKTNNTFDYLFSKSNIMTTYFVWICSFWNEHSSKYQLSPYNTDKTNSLKNIVVPVFKHKNIC